MADDTTTGEVQEVDVDTTTDETDWKAKYEAMRAHSRDWESKAKANQSAADELKKLQEASKTEHEKAIERAQKAEAELEKYKAQAERMEVIARVAKNTKLPVEVVQLLNGSDESELTEQAKAIKKISPAYPTRNDEGGTGAAKRSNADRFAEALGL